MVNDLINRFLKGKSGTNEEGLRTIPCSIILRQRLQLLVHNYCDLYAEGE